MASPGALDEHLGDQILFPAALLASGRLGGQGAAVSRFSVERVTDHLRTHATVLERFLTLSRLLLLARALDALGESDGLFVPRPAKTLAEIETRERRRQRGRRRS